MTGPTESGHFGLSHRPHAQTLVTIATSGARGGVARRGERGAPGADDGPWSSAEARRAPASPATRLTVGPGRVVLPRSNPDAVMAAAADRQGGRTARYCGRCVAPVRRGHVLIADHAARIWFRPDQLDGYFSASGCWHCWLPPPPPARSSEATGH